MAEKLDICSMFAPDLKLWVIKYFTSEFAPLKGRELYNTLEAKPFILIQISEHGYKFLYFIQQEHKIKIKLDPKYNNMFCSYKYFSFINDDINNYESFLRVIQNLSSGHIYSLLYQKYHKTLFSITISNFYTDFNILEYIISLSTNIENIKYFKRIIFYIFFQMLFKVCPIDIILESLSCQIDIIFNWFYKNNYISNNKITNSLLFSYEENTEIISNYIIDYYFMNMIFIKDNPRQISKSPKVRKKILKNYNFFKDKLKQHINMSENRLIWICCCIRSCMLKYTFALNSIIYFIFNKNYFIFYF